MHSCCSCYDFGQWTVVWSEKLKIVLLIMPCYQKLPFDMGFKKNEKFFKNGNGWLMARFIPRGPKLPKIEFFHKNGLFTVNYFFTINQYHALSYTVRKNS